VEFVVLAMKTEGSQIPDIKDQRLLNDLYSDSYKRLEMKGKKKASLPDSLQAS